MAAWQPHVSSPTLARSNQVIRGGILQTGDMNRTQSVSKEWSPSRWFPDGTGGPIGGIVRGVAQPTVAPGGMETNLIAGIELPEGANMELMARYSGIRGMVEVEDVAAMVAFLASPAARAFHGDCITMDKGITAG